MGQGQNKNFIDSDTGVNERVGKPVQSMAARALTGDAKLEEIALQALLQPQFLSSKGLPAPPPGLRTIRPLLPARLWRLVPSANSLLPRPKPGKNEWLALGHHVAARNGINTIFRL
jgi:hypothetical protein